MMPHPERGLRSGDGFDGRLDRFPISCCRRGSRPLVAMIAEVSESAALEHGLTREEYAPRERAARARADAHGAGHRQRDVERALLLQKLAAPSQETADQGARGFWSDREKTPASSISAAAGRRPSRSSRTITPATSSRSRERRPASAEFCATFSPWAPGPVAVMDALRFGPLDAPRTGMRNRHILKGVVGGIAHYGNCFGVPTVGGECVFADSYSGNPLVNAFALGVFAKDSIFLGSAKGVGNPVIYVGAKTGPGRHPGRFDGLGRVSMKTPQPSGPTCRWATPFPRKALARSLSRSNGYGGGARHSGHGRRGADLLDGGNGRPRAASA